MIHIIEPKRKLCGRWLDLRKSEWRKKVENAIVRRVRQAMLTKRQTEICERVVEGLPDKDIASELGISEETVNFHLRKVFRKFKVHSRFEAAVIYVKVKTRGISVG